MQGQLRTVISNMEVVYGMVWYGVVWCGVVWCGVPHSADSYRYFVFVQSKTKIIVRNTREGVGGIR